MESQVCLVPGPETMFFALYITTCYVTTRSSVRLTVKAHNKASSFIFLRYMYGNTYGITIQMLTDGDPIAADLKQSKNTVHKYSPASDFLQRKLILIKIKHLVKKIQ